MCDNNFQFLSVPIHFWEMHFWHATFFVFIHAVDDQLNFIFNRVNNFWHYNVDGMAFTSSIAKRIIGKDDRK